MQFAIYLPLISLSVQMYSSYRKVMTYGKQGEQNQTLIQNSTYFPGLWDYDFVYLRHNARFAINKICISKKKRAYLYRKKLAFKNQLIFQKKNFFLIEL